MKFDLEKTRARIEGMTEGQLLEWLEPAVAGMQRHLEVYQRTRNGDHLAELAIAEMTVNLVIEELVERKFGRPVPSAPSEPETVTDTTSARRGFLKGLRGRTGSADVRRDATND